MVVATEIQAYGEIDVTAVALKNTDWGSVTVSITRGKVMNKVPNFIEELELYPLWFWFSE